MGHALLVTRTRLPEVLTAQTPFDVAAGVLEAWLDADGAAFASRTTQPAPHRKRASWDFVLQHATLGPQRVQFTIPRDFPASVPQVYFDKRLCLALPHIEETGRFCHGVEPSPQDYVHAIGVAHAVLKALDDFWQKSNDAAWVLSEFQRERLSYWQRFCEKFRLERKLLTPHDVRVALSPLEGVTEGQLASYFLQGPNSRSKLLLATVGEADPQVLAARHGWSVGTLVRGHVLFVPVPDNVRWTPSDWPQSLGQLESLVAQVTDYQQSVVHWIESKQDEKPHPFMVVIVQDKVCYGYIVMPSPMPRLKLPGIAPVVIDRVDADWALSRDYQLDLLTARRQKRVLVLGCGSLGAPVAELLARSGVGELHLLDKEGFEAENCSRHVLGAADIGVPKPNALGKRLQMLIPGLTVKSHFALAADWLQHVCNPGAYDFVLDCTGESSIRVMLSHFRELAIGPCPIVHAWVEPFCAATHVVHLAASDNWPLDDPGTKVAAAQWPQDARVNLPACGAGFHPYGAADVWQSAGFTAERVLAVLDGKVQQSIVWSSIRSKAYFDSLGVEVELGPLVPASSSTFDSIQVTRSFADLLSKND
jgi:sulfur-carrier protein adenylyltransferase/sulfurtransferase